MRLLLTRFSGYFVTGGLSAIVDVLGFMLLLELGVQKFAAATISFAVAATQNYFLTTRFVYDHPASWRMFAAFMVTLMFGMIFNVSVTMFALILMDGMAPLAKIAGIGVAFLVNFLMVNFVVFARKDTP